MTTLGPSAGAVLQRTHARRSYPLAWWGMVMLIATEGMIFGLLLSANFFLMAQADRWPPAGVEEPKLGLVTAFSFVLWLSSAPIVRAEKAIARGRLDVFKRQLALSFVMGCGFVAYSLYDFNELKFGWRDHAYGSLHYTIIGLHLTHVVIGLVFSAGVQVKAWLGRYESGRHVSAMVFALYWHFVDVVWLFVFPSMFIAPRLVR